MCNTIRLSSACYAHLKRTIGNMVPEAGGVIGTPIGNPNYISHAWFDAEASGTGGKSVYVPSFEKVTQVVRRWTDRDSVRFAGIVHSHGERYLPRLSSVDIRSALAILRANAMPFIDMLLFHGGKLFAFRVFPNGTTEEMQLIIEPTSPNSKSQIQNKV